MAHPMGYCETAHALEDDERFAKFMERRDHVVLYIAVIVLTFIALVAE